ncbi:paired immunoglobulin-like type 2 receptor alpha [Rhincodon typus]|uniref:paired immunoglobulin-like type 2 receptor alpha n=1 Tax=Rhincodon typus TaxID=259920 RepID=UPI00202F7B75|nr:paired immunoglobulin-like type 2 receptor alpha [Rhincodon typus]
MIKGNSFTVNQPDRLEGVKGGSIEIPCTFAYPDRYRPTRMNILWRRWEFHGELNFNMSRRYTHPEYRERIQFLGLPYKERTGTIRIKQLRRQDTTRYYCRVETTGNGEKIWQNIAGTFLTVRAQRSTTTTISVPSSVSASSEHSADGEDPLAQGLILIIRAVIAFTILATLWLVGIYLMKRKEVTESADGNM